MAALDHFTLWFTTSLIAVAVLCSYLLKKYASAPQKEGIDANKNTASTTIKVLTFIGWFMGFATIALLPLDIALAD